jgi:putative transcriptional regulator
MTNMPFSGVYALRNSRQIAQELGTRLERIRLSRNLTQAQLAEQAGVNTRTIVRLEQGMSPTLDTFIRVLLALGIASNLEALLPDADIRPIERVLNRGRERRRARPSAAKAEQSVPFRWGDEEPPR